MLGAWLAGISWRRGQAGSVDHSTHLLVFPIDFGPCIDCCIGCGSNERDGSADMRWQLAVELDVCWLTICSFFIRRPDIIPLSADRFGENYRSQGMEVSTNRTSGAVRILTADTGHAVCADGSFLSDR